MTVAMLDRMKYLAVETIKLENRMKTSKTYDALPQYRTDYTICLARSKIVGKKKHKEGDDEQQRPVGLIDQGG
jgi:hypothetical protein